MQDNANSSADWTKAANQKPINTTDFVRRLRDMRAGKPVEWKCPFCGAEVVLMGNEEGRTLIGCSECDMRISLELQ